jgi:hypothetical protein
MYRVYRDSAMIISLVEEGMVAPAWHNVHPHDSAYREFVMLQDGT